MHLVLDDFEFGVRATAVIKHIVPGLKIAFEKTNGGAIDRAVRFL